MSTPVTSQQKDYGLSPENVLFLREYIERESGIVLGEGKEYLLHSRLSPIAEQSSLPSVNDLCSKLRGTSHPPLKRAIIEAITTHETLFFRDMPVFECLRTAILPEIAERRAAAKAIRIWSAGCSSGQEAYSLAMMLLEAGYGDWNIQIVGTDLSSQIVERAGSGKFLRLEVNRGLPAALLVKYFQRAGSEWQGKDPVRRGVSFSVFDLRDEMRPLGQFDLVLCRNVLIYFDVATRKKILANIREILSPSGYLVLGSSETTFGLDDGYTRKTIANTVIYQKPV